MSGRSEAELTAELFADQLPAGSVRMADVFALAKRFVEMDLEQVERLLESPVRELGVGAVQIMDFQARRRSTPEARRKADLSALPEAPRPNRRLGPGGPGRAVGDRRAPGRQGARPALRPARSESVWERRTAIVATWHFIRHGELDDTFGIAELLVDDHEHLIQTAVGGWVRGAGKRDLGRLRASLDTHAATMPRTTLRYAIEHLDADERRRYRVPPPPEESSWT